MVQTMVTIGVIRFVVMILTVDYMVVRGANAANVSTVEAGFVLTLGALGLVAMLGGFGAALFAMLASHMPPAAVIAVILAVLLVGAAA